MNYATKFARTFILALRLGIAKAKTRYTARTGDGGAGGHKEFTGCSAGFSAAKFFIVEINGYLKRHMMRCVPFKQYYMFYKNTMYCYVINSKSFIWEYSIIF